MPVFPSEAETYELPELSERSSSPRLYGDHLNEEDGYRATESARLLKAQDEAKVPSEGEEDVTLLSRAPEEEGPGKGTDITALIARVSASRSSNIRLHNLTRL